MSQLDLGVKVAILALTSWGNYFHLASEFELHHLILRSFSSNISPSGNLVPCLTLTLGSSYYNWSHWVIYIVL